MADRYVQIISRFTDEQIKALDRAIEKNEKRTGSRLIQSDIVRGWVGKFCESEGERWPSFQASPQSKRAERRRRAISRATAR